MSKLQDRDRLIFIFSTLAKNITLAQSELQFLLNGLPKRSTTYKYQAILRLLHLHQVIHTKHKKHSKNQQYQHIQLLGNILKAISICLKISYPLKYLAQGQLELFQKFCLASKEQYLHVLGRKAYGMFPQIRLNEEQQQYSSAFYISVRDCSGYIGNPNWLLARSIFCSWYVQNKYKMKEQVQQICQFLLSSEELLASRDKDCFQHLWYVLYCYYNQLYFNSHLLNPNETLVSWKNQSAGFYFDIFEHLKVKMQNYQKVIYYLIASLFKKSRHFDQGLIFQFSYLQAAFREFQLSFRDVPQQQHLLTLVFFQIIATLSKEVQISTKSHQKFKEILLCHPSIVDAVPLMQYFLTPSQFVHICEKLNLQIWSLNINEITKRNISRFLLDKNIINQHTLQYLSSQQFKKYIFHSKLLKQSAYLDNLLNLLDVCQSVMLQKLKQISQEKQEQNVKQNFNRFVDVWKSYRQLSESQNMNNAQKVIKTSKKNFSKKFKQIFYLPRDDLQIVFQTLMSYARAVKLQVNSMDLTEQLKSRIKQFQNECLSQILSMISAENRDNFWKEWAHVLKKDKQFVQDICQC